MLSHATMMFVARMGWLFALYYAGVGMAGN